MADSAEFYVNNNTYQPHYDKYLWKNLNIIFNVCLYVFMYSPQK